MTGELEPGAQLATRPDAPAVIMGGGGTVVTYAELDARSKRLARLFHAAGLRAGDHVAVMLENHPRYFEVVWGAQRMGLYTTPINWHLKPDEAGYIIEDCGATALITSYALAGLAAELEPRLAALSVRLMMDGTTDGYERYEDAIAQHPAEPLLDEVEGSLMFYSSGTTGRPKGIKRTQQRQPFGSGGGALIMSLQRKYGITRDTVYLCPAPLYHAAPLGWSITAQRLGATVVVMETFDPVRCLELIERHASPMPSSCRPISCACSSCRTTCDVPTTRRHCRWSCMPPRRARSTSNAG